MHKITVMGTSDKLKSMVCDDYTKVLIRTETSEAYEIMLKRGIDFETLDFMYDKAENFTELDALLAGEVIAAAGKSDVVYVVPGSAVAGDGSVKEIAAQYENVEIIWGDAPEYAMLAGLADADTSSGYAVIPAACLEKGVFSPRLPLIVTALDNALLLSDVKLLLADEYGDEHEVFIGAGSKYEKMKIYEADRAEGVDHDTMMYIPPKTSDARYDGFELEQVFKKLRAPGGCPWDREQTHVSLKRYLLEECAEVLDAIDGGDMWELMDELGDVLLQVLFHATIAGERGDFGMRDIIDNLVRKLMKRHPHVFADAKAENAEQVLKRWDEIKHEDKEDKSITAKLKSVPKSMTALMRAQKVLSRAHKAGILSETDNDMNAVVRKIENGLGSLRKEDNERRDAAIRMLLFDIANLFRILGVESELILHDATKRYIKEVRKRESGGKSDSFS